MTADVAFLRRRRGRPILASSERLEEIARHLSDERRPCFESAATYALRPLQITHPIYD